MGPSTADPTTEADRTEGGPWPGRVAAGATALTLALVLFRIGDKSLWYDEAYSVGTIDRPVGDALWRIANWEVNQSPFFLLLTGWWRLGQSETFIRLLPACFAVLAVPAMYSLARRLLGAPGGAVAAVLLAAHPLVVEWGQQVRGYSLVLLLTILTAIQALRALEVRDSRWRAVGAGALGALATYGHFFAGLVVVALAAWALLHRPVPVALLRRAAATYVVLCAPLALFLVTREGDPLYWLGDRSFGDAFADSARALSAGTNWGLAPYGVGVAAGLVAAARAWRTDAGAPSGLALAAIWFAGPVAVVVTSTLTVKPLLEGRFLIVVLPAVVILAAAGAASLGRTAGPVTLALLLAASAVGVERWYTAPPLQDWRGAVELLDRSVVPEADVVLHPPRAVHALRYYEDRLGLPPHDVVRPALFDPPAGDDLAEIRIVANGRPTPLPDVYLAWRDEHYGPRSDYSVNGLEIRMFERR